MVKGFSLDWIKELEAGDEVVVVRPFGIYRAVVAKVAQGSIELENHLRFRKLDGCLCGATDSRGDRVVKPTPEALELARLFWIVQKQNPIAGRS